MHDHNDRNFVILDLDCIPANRKVLAILIHQINEIRLQPSQADVLNILKQLFLNNFNTIIICGHNIMLHVHEVLVRDLDKSGHHSDAITIQNKASW